MEKDFSFGVALEKMKTDALMVSRREWDRGRSIYIGLQNPDRESKNTLPYLYMVKDGERFPATLSCESLLAEDWYVMDFGQEKSEDDEDGEDEE